MSEITRVGVGVHTVHSMLYLDNIISTVDRQGDSGVYTRFSALTCPMAYTCFAQIRPALLLPILHPRLHRYLVALRETRVTILNRLDFSFSSKIDKFPEISQIGVTTSNRRAAAFYPTCQPKNCEGLTRSSIDSNRTTTVTIT